MDAQTRPARATRDLHVVDLRGLKPVLAARRKAEQVSVSVLVRQAIEQELDLGDAAESGDGAMPAESTSNPSSIPPTVRLSVRMAAAGADRFIAGAQAASLSRSAQLAGLVAGVPALTDSASPSGKKLMQLFWRSCCGVAAVG